MGVYIPNMSKPKSCVECKFTSPPEGECWFVHSPNDCPLIEIDDIKFKACLEILDKFMDELDHSLLYGKARD